MSRTRSFAARLDRVAVRLPVDRREIVRRLVAVAVAERRLVDVAEGGADAEELDHLYHQLATADAALRERRNTRPRKEHAVTYELPPIWLAAFSATTESETIDALNAEWVRTRSAIQVRDGRQAIGSLPDGSVYHIPGETRRRGELDLAGKIAAAARAVVMMRPQTVDRDAVLLAIDTWTPEPAIVAQAEAIVRPADARYGA